MGHSDTLKQLFPVGLDGVLDADVTAEATAFDLMEVEYKGVSVEMFPDTTEELISRWEYRYGIVPPAGATIQQRQAAIVARRRQRGGCDEAYYVKVAAGLGYTITITQHDDLCRLPATLPDSLYERGDVWKWTVDVYGAASAPNLETCLNNIKRAHTEITFVYHP